MGIDYRAGDILPARVEDIIHREHLALRVEGAGACDGQQLRIRGLAGIHCHGGAVQGAGEGAAVVVKHVDHELIAVGASLEVRGSGDEALRRGAVVGGR